MDCQLIDTAYKKAIGVLKKNSTDFGFQASFGTNYVDQIWGRDGCIAILGANLTGDKALLKTSRRTLETFGRFQSNLGQIPTVYRRKLKICDWGVSGATDASAWYIIAVWNYFKTTQDKCFLKRTWPSVEKAMHWLQCQDANNFGLIDSPEAGDWMDSTIQRCGKVFYINCLFYEAARCIERICKILRTSYPVDSEKIKDRINLLFWPDDPVRFIASIHHVESLDQIGPGFGHIYINKVYRIVAKRKKEHYLSHVSYERFENICDSFANSLAILWDIADKKKQNKILAYFKRKKVSRPYPVRSLDPPILKPGCNWKYKSEGIRSKEQKSLPFCYHNAGIWPFIGGFYILTLVKAGKKKEAAKELEKLALANKRGRKQEWEFNEWLHGKTGKPLGAPLQSWSAAGYIMAHKAVMENKLI